MARRNCDVAIIGAGTAGLHAYKAAHAAGADVVLIERGDGGSTCTATGCIPSKLLIAAGRAAWEARRTGLFGIRVGEVEVDGAAVMRRLRAERDRSNGQIADEYRSLPAKHRLHGEARFTGLNSLQVGAEHEVHARAVVIATGGRPDVPSCLKPVRNRVRTHEDIFELQDLPRSLAVIGAGPLGLELAQAFARLGVAVTVLDKGKRLGALKDAEAEECARSALSREFAIHLGIEIEAEMKGDQAVLRWQGDSAGEVAVDLVLAATGRTPDLAALDLAAACIVPNDKGGLDFDKESHRCGSAPVFVAGDVSGWRPVLHEAARGGCIAGGVATGGQGSPPLPSLAIAFTEPNLVTIGSPADALPDGAIIGESSVDDNARASIDGLEEGLVRLYADRKGHLLGGTIVLTGGEHLGQALALAIAQGLDATTFADQAWYHPVLEEMLQRAARDVARQVTAS